MEEIARITLRDRKIDGLPIVLFSPNGTYLLGENTESIAVSNLQTGEIKTLQHGNPGYNHSTPTLSNWNEFTKAVREHRRGAPIRSTNPHLPTHSNNMTRIAVNHEETLVAAGSATTGIISVWDIQSGAVRALLKSDELPVSGLAFLQDGKRLISVHY